MPSLCDETQESQTIPAVRTELVVSETRSVYRPQKSQSLIPQFRLARQTEELGVERSKIDVTEVAKCEGLAGKDFVFRKGVLPGAKVFDLFGITTALITRPHFAHLEDTVT
jgi:hypothetical protein